LHYVTTGVLSSALTCATLARFALIGLVSLTTYQHSHKRLREQKLDWSRVVISLYSDWVQWRLVWAKPKPGSAAICYAASHACPT